MKLRAAIAAIALLLTLTNPLAAQAAGYSVNPNQAAIVNLRDCQTEADLDCVQSVSTVDDAGVETPLKFVMFHQDASWTDSVGNVRYPGSLHYEGMSLQVELETPLHHLTKDLTGGALRIFATPDAAHEKSLFRIAFRTSWLKPQDIQMKASQAVYSVKKITGGKLWTFDGIQTQMSDYDYAKVKANPGYQGVADRTIKTFQIFIHHSDKRGSYFGTQCDDKGFTVESHNAPGAGQPYWNAAKNSLEFNIQAAHLTVDGKENVGFFRYWVNDAYLACAFPGNSLIKATNVIVNVTDSNGETQTAVSFVSHHDGQLIVWVDGFHFSSPTISVRPAGAKQTITCVKGSTTKKVTAVSPKCPAGYKKK